MWQELRPGDRGRSERRRLARPLTMALLAACGLAVTACTPQTSGPVTPPATLAPTAFGGRQAGIGQDLVGARDEAPGAHVANDTPGEE
jgi:hypothetical protein